MTKKTEQEKRSEMAKALGKAGGKASAEKRFSGMTEAQISETMRKIRYTKEDKERTDKMAEELVTSLRKQKFTPKIG